ncbi:hypothetical protein HNO88_004191 [Novosphingobium chloroacetimidivorans]|uniref:DUF2059 domain-containing protein n=1 Tax=Novosphingobium chloroacetimidivorans TaxID=1428314 RepID=A0A7W7KDJ1_9SPHN|nr:DUF2059 domain-containing protein [Novosphingobium chloroacetimidivorans]MBB4860846.1 hypothetical protein [Novosphingobium chloroacetimidivorans]
MRLVLAAAGAAFLALAVPVTAAEPAPASATEAARLASAKQTVDYVFPTGTYARMMGETMDKMMDSILDSTMRMPLKNFAGVSGAETGEIGEGSLAEMMEIYDPAYKERMRLSTRTMMTEMSTLMSRFEPDIRSGLASAYAKRFDAAQLGELNRFFATPTGKTYAAESYIIMMSPEVMEKMQGFMPQVMQAMPSIVEKVKSATEKLPKPRMYVDLSDAEKAKLARILGMSLKQLEEKEAAKADTVAPAEDEAE